MDINKNDTAVVYDPQNEVLSEKAARGAVGDSVKEKKTVEHGRIFKAAKENGFGLYLAALLLSHRQWMEIQRTLETDEFENKMFARSGRLSLDGFSVRRRLARALQALYRGRQDGRC
jgi:hypothetical protein